MNRIFAFLCFFYLSSSSWGQIVNIESKRIDMDTTGWSGAFGVSLSLISNTKQLLSTRTKAHIQWKPSKKDVLLLVGQYGLTKSDKQVFQDFGFGHVRYTRYLIEHFALESFAQAQYNKVNQLKFRGLMGIGPRYHAVTSTKFNLFVATIFMLEREITKQEKFFEGGRISTYVNFTFQPNTLFKFINTTYYQPRLTLLSDYRVATEARMEWAITGHLKFKSAFLYNFDVDPPEGALQQNYILNNGLTFSF